VTTRSTDQEASLPGDDERPIVTAFGFVFLGESCANGGKDSVAAKPPATVRKPRRPGRDDGAPPLRTAVTGVCFFITDPHD